MLLLGKVSRGKGSKPMAVQWPPPKRPLKGDTRQVRPQGRPPSPQRVAQVPTSPLAASPSCPGPVQEGDGSVRGPSFIILVILFFTPQATPSLSNQGAASCVCSLPFVLRERFLSSNRMKIERSELAPLCRCEATGRPVGWGRRYGNTSPKRVLSAGQIPKQASCSLHRAVPPRITIMMQSV